MGRPRTDLNGKVFGSWTVIEFSHINTQGRAYWKCRCACGVEKSVSASSLSRGGSLKCRSCAGRERQKDLTGQKFGSWYVVGFSHRDEGRRAFWSCVCACGSEKKVPQSSLVSGNTSKCFNCTKVVSGPYGRTLYTVWNNIKNRCSDPQNGSWNDYGGRGIYLCERWKDVRLFIKDMEPGYRTGLTVDRIDNDGPYSPDNCRWATRSEQANNTRRNRNIEWNGKTANITEWERLLKMRPGQLRHRINKGWEIDKALTKDVDPDTLAKFYS